MERIRFAVVIPLFNEVESVLELNSRVDRVVSDLSTDYPNFDFEKWYVNDGSTDKTQSELEKIVLNSKNTNFIQYKRNFGQTYALMAGLRENSDKDYVITLDGDLQHLPEEIPDFINKIISSDFDLICGWRSNRAETFLRRFPSKVANKLIQSITGLKINDYGTTFRIIRGSLINKLEVYSEFHRFIPALVYNLGGKVGEIKIKNVNRKFGKSNYGLSRTLGVFSDLILLYFFFKYKDKPLRFFFKISIVPITLSATIILAYFVYGIFTQGVIGLISERPGFFAMAMIGLIVGIQFLSTGLIIEYIIRNGRRDYPITVKKSEISNN